MKQFSPITTITGLLDSLDSDGGLRISGFHPDFFLPLINAIDRDLFITVPNNCFTSASKYLSSLWDNNSVVFISPSSVDNNVPVGFSASENHLAVRAKELLAEGLESIKIIFSSHDGISLPILSCGIENRLAFTLGVSFEDCYDFLVLENYVSAEFVTTPGEFATRGGIIDVFPFSSFCPYRINFFDDRPTIFRFNVDSQLTTETIDNFILSSISKNEPKALKDVSLKRFLPIVLDSLETLSIGKINALHKSLKLQTLTHRQFFKIDNNIYNSVVTTNDLSSIGLIDENNNIAVPSWFVEKDISQDKGGEVYTPLVLSEIKRGDYLVHRDHGVGVCLGLALKDDGASSQEFLSIKYSDGGMISTDTGSLDLIAFFAPADAEGVSLDSLSKKGNWMRKKTSAKKRAEEVIQHLLGLYVKRGDLSRDPFPQDISLEKPFISSFPFEDTPDQIRAWDEISSDLSASSPMDRLLCGDVGFGKTELAIRAAFRVVLSNKRVVVLSPTTILANQLNSSFSARLEPNAISVDMVSRFRSQNELLSIKKNINENNNDVLIGTHAVLNDDIYLKNIGLLIIDEEHRFGVKQKEKIKRFKSSVDVLSMSATPIPRSMNLAISGIYSVSMLQTPPKLRLPIKTQIEYYNDGLIKDAINFEVSRGGQAYFVHNDIISIKSVAHKLSGLFSKYTVDFIHGQESPGNIEKKMSAFVSGKTDILVCTSIIESGIDVPSANSIIINNSHLFGLSQLYQMRGRVGRGREQAYAYLLIPKGMSLSEKAFKRIKSIEENISLGSGYNISMTDMEIRGSGSLFGYKQSGGSGSMGYEMYTRMIQRVLHDSGKLGSGFRILPEDVVIELYSQRFIPEKYISLENIRMSVYKSLATATTERELNDILYNLVNRFGPAPDPLINLLNESRLRLYASRVGVCSVRRRACGYECSIENRNENSYSAAVLDYAQNFFLERELKYHIIPTEKAVLSLCIHLEKDEDSYSIFSRFFGKFDALVKVN